VLPIAVGIQNPSHLFSFVEAVEQTTNPAKWARFEKRQAAIKAKTGVDLNSLLKLATGSLIIASNTHKTMGRAGVSDPTAAKSALAKLVTLPSAVLGKGTSVDKLGGGFYAIKQRGSSTIDIGVVGNQLLAGNATPAQLRTFAVAPTSQASGAQGSVAFRIGLAQVLQLAMKQSPSKIAQTILSSLGDITGWTAASANELTGSASVAVH
jgi:hypothetical protein